MLEDTTPQNIIQPDFVRSPVVTMMPDHVTPILYVHTKRPKWGRALCVWNRDGRRAFQFEDGNLRVIAQSHMHLFSRARLPTTEAIDVARELRSAAGISMARRAHESAGTGPLMDLVQQVALFRDEYPEGFADAKWSKKVRGVGVKKALKRHRNPVLELAREKLSPVELAALIANMDGTEFVSRVQEVLAATDLVNKKDVALLDRMSVTHAVALATALRNVLVGDGPLDARMQRYLDALTRSVGQHPRWQLATALLALIDPLAHVWVRPGAVREQAKSIAPQLQLANQPTGRAYAQVCDMVQVVARKLCAEGMAPDDLMDVTDFMWSTLRPVARRKFKELVASRRTAVETKDEPQAEVDAA